MSIGPVTPGSYTTVTPDAPQAPYASITVPSPTMPVVAADVAALGLEVLNIQNSIYMGSGNLAEMAAVTGAVEPSPGFGGSWFRAYGVGWFYFSSSSSATPDSLWVVAGVGGKWLHEHYLVMGTSAAFCMVGLVPGYAGRVAGRIPTSVVPYGYFVSGNIAGGSDFTTDATPITITAGAVINIGGAAGVITVGTLAIGDVLTFQLPIVGYNISSFFSAGAYVSFDGGATEVAVSPQPGGGSPVYYQDTTGGSPKTQPILMDFVVTVPSAGLCEFVLKFNAPAGTTHVTWGPGRYRVERP